MAWCWSGICGSERKKKKASRTLLEERCPFMSEDANQLVRKIKDEKASAPIETAVFAYLKIGDEAMAWIAFSINRSIAIRRLHLDHNIIGGEGAIALSKALSFNVTLCEVRLNCNCIDDSGIDALADVLEENRSITQLSVSKNSFTAVGGVRIASAIRRNHTLKELDLSDNNIAINNDTVSELQKSLERNKTLTLLDIYGGDISDEGGVSIANIIKTSRLKSLNFGLNQLTDASGVEIASALSNNKSLTQLLATNNLLSDGTAEALCDNLTENVTLACLNLGMNQLTETGVGRLDRFRKKGIDAGITTLKYINVYDNPGTTSYFANVWATKE